MAATAKPIDALFTKTQQRVLALLFCEQAECTLAELVRRSGGGSGAIRREVERMTAAAILKERRVGSQRRFSADPASAFYPELKSVAAKAAVASARRPLRRPSAALIAHRAEVRRLLARHGLKNPRVFGSVALGKDTESSDLDILIDAPRGVSMLDIVGAQQAIEDVLGVRLDLVTPMDLPESFRAAALAEAVPL